MRTFLFALALFSSLNVLAEELKMAVITSDIDKEMRDFYLITDNDNNIDSIRYVTYLPTGQILGDETVPAVRVMQDGVVVVERDGRDAVRMETESNFNVEQGGNIRLNYLYSGITNSRKVLSLVVKRVGSMWFLKTTKDQPVNRIMVYGNWHRVFGLIGIRDIEATYKH